MKSYKVSELSEQDVYKLLSGTVVPRPIAWLTTQDMTGLVNAAPFSFFNVVSSDPAIVSISMTDMKDSARNLLATGEGVIHLVNPDNLHVMNQTAAALPADESEVQKFDLTMKPSEMVDVPGIENARVRLEVKLYQHIPVGRSHLMLLKVVNFVFADEAVVNPENFHIDAKRLNPMARLAGNDFARLGDTIELRRPD
ncbi:MAG: flavin reductase family protein [Streptococcaceae bacterium]|jgi:flavin reductase (DIM6/NTAB) family NADH-FMN oxidoreductase RutF|nr:flavin reductase family protein [Streptococcaceae bacterium]